jgi:hemoglobin
MVMELYTAQLEGEAPVTDADGKLVNGNLAKVFVLGKGDGWGQDVSENLESGNWVFAS